MGQSTKNRISIKSKTFPLNHGDFSDCLSTLRAPKMFWSSPGQPPILGSGSAHKITMNGSDRFQSVRQRANRLFNNLELIDDNSKEAHRKQPRFFGGLSFTSNVNSDGPWAPLGAVSFVLPRRQFTKIDNTVWVTLNGNSLEDIEEEFKQLKQKIESQPFDNGQIQSRHVETMTHQPRRERWLRNVQEVVQSIRNEQLKKLVLAQRMDLRFDRPLDTNYLLPILRKASEKTYRYLFKTTTGTTFIGTTPETLVCRQGSTVKTESLAGTVRIGRTTEEKQDLADELISNAKNQREHELVLNTIRQRLNKYVSEVKPGEQSVRTFPSVQHLYTPIMGTLDHKTHVLELASDLHPTPAVGGTPIPDFEKFRKQYESFERGWYASPVGWFDRHGNGEFAVAIRSARIKGRDAALYAGAGLVEDSQPEKEWDEVQWKFDSMLNVLQHK